MVVAETISRGAFARASQMVSVRIICSHAEMGSVSVSGNEDVAQVTQLLQRWQSGDVTATSHIAERVYATLHEMAQAKMAVRGQAGVMLQPTALVNEALMRLLAGGGDYKDRVHFYATASLKMRAVLVDYARTALADKRGGGAEHLTLSAIDAAGGTGSQDEYLQLLSLHQALENFARLDPRAAQAIELSYFGGMNQEEIALAMGLSVATIERDLRIARAWLRNALTIETATPAATL